jgi:hypothetical protein
MTTPYIQPICKVKLFYKSFKYDGKCYNCCGDCGCPCIVICMRRVDVTMHLNCNRAIILADDDETPCSQPGLCCDKAKGCCG